MSSDYKQEFIAQYKSQYCHDIDVVRKECYPQLSGTPTYATRDLSSTRDAWC